MIADVDAFRVAWQAASAVVVEERPNANVQAALDRLAEGIVARVAHGSTVEAALKPFEAAVKKGDGMTSDPSSLGATAFRDGDRWLVDVRMGFASSVSAFGPKGRLSLPPSLRWSYRQFGPFFRTGAFIAFDGSSLSDAGVRYTYALEFLRRTKLGYASAGVARGTWSYGESADAHLVAHGSRVTVTTIDSPRAFFTDNATQLVRRTETWNTSGSTARRTSVQLLDGDVRAADAWLFSHRGRRVGGGVVPKEATMLNSFRRGPRWVELDFDEAHFRFDLTQSKGGRFAVRKVTVG